MPPTAAHAMHRLPQIKPLMANTSARIRLLEHDGLAVVLAEYVVSWLHTLVPMRNAVSATPAALPVCHCVYGHVRCDGANVML